MDAKKQNVTGRDRMHKFNSAPTNEIKTRKLEKKDIFKGALCE